MRLTSVLVAGCVAAVVAAAAVDALRGNGSEPQPSPEPAEAAAGPPVCGEGQLALELVVRDDLPVVVLRYARGPRCTVPERDVRVQVIPAYGRPRGGVLVRGGWIDSAHCRDECQLATVGGLFAPGIQVERTFRYRPRCEERGPFEAVARSGPWAARAVIPVVPCARTAEELAAFQHSCVDRWNEPANRANRAAAARRGHTLAALYRWADGAGEERCALRFLLEEVRWLLAPRGPGAWRDVGGEQPGVAASEYAEVGVRPDGTLALPSG